MKAINIGRVCVSILMVFLSSCASHYPDAINQDVNADVSVKDIQNGLKVDSSLVVRWGGVIANINNHQKETWLEVVQLPLARNGEPENSDSTEGRFLVKINAFLDPAIYAKGRVFTVVGALSGVTKGKIGEHDYQYPVVNAQGYTLWPERKEVIYQTLYYPVSYWDPYFSYYYPHYYYRGHSRRTDSSSQERSGSARSSSSSRRSEAHQPPRTIPRETPPPRAAPPRAAPPRIPPREKSPTRLSPKK